MGRHKRAFFAGELPGEAGLAARAAAGGVTYDEQWEILRLPREPRRRGAGSDQVERQAPGAKYSPANL